MLVFLFVGLLACFLGAKPAIRETFPVDGSHCSRDTTTMLIGTHFGLHKQVPIVFEIFCIGTTIAIAYMAIPIFAFLDNLLFKSNK